MFGESVKENIRFGKLEATDEEVIEAAKLANAMTLCFQTTQEIFQKVKHSY